MQEKLLDVDNSKLYIVAAEALEVSIAIVIKVSTC